MLADLGERRLPASASTPVRINALLRRHDCQVVTWRGWQEIDAAEAALGNEYGSARTKITDLARLIEIGISQDH